MTEDEMAGWHRWLDGHEFEWTPGVGDGQAGLVCCDSWGRKESDMTERLNWTEVIKAKKLRKTVGWERLEYRSVGVQFSHSVVSDSLRPYEPQHARPPCPSPAPRVHSDSRPSSRWCHPAISSSVIPFSCPQFKYSQSLILSLSNISPLLNFLIQFAHQ